jgi:hypothetical protein
VIGINGLAGNLGIAVAALVTGFLVKWFGWRAAFALPGVLAILCGIVFALACPKEVEAPHKRKGGKAKVVLTPAMLARAFAVMTSSVSPSMTCAMRASNCAAAVGYAHDNAIAIHAKALANTPKRSRAVTRPLHRKRHSGCSLRSFPTSGASMRSTSSRPGKRRCSHERLRNARPRLPAEKSSCSYFEGLSTNGIGPLQGC